MRLGGQSFLNFFFRSRLLEGLEGGNDGTRKVASSSSKMSCSATSSSFFRVNEAAGTVEVDEGSGNAFHLGPILRKYTAAKLTVMPGRRLTTVELSRLWDAIGLLRSLQYDVAQFNTAAVESASLAPSTIRYACFRLNRQAAAFGVRVPRPGEGQVVIPGLDDLVNLVEKANQLQIETSQTMISGGLCDFDSLSELFRPGTDLLDRGACTGLFGVPTAFRVRASYNSRGKSLFGVVSTFFAAVECVVATGSRFAVVESHMPMVEFAGTRSVNDGFDHLVRLSEATRADLVQRGLIYSRLSSGHSYMEYSPGTFTASSPRAGSTAVRALTARARGGGRIMVDTHAALARGVSIARSEGTAAEAVRSVLKLLAQRERQGGLASSGGGVGVDAGNGQAAASAEEESSLELLLLSAPLPDSLLCLTWPLVTGFSFAAKCWGTATVSGLRDISFNEAAFERLVLPPSRKNLIAALVGSYKESDRELGGAGVLRTDIIAGKGEGTIFLLHGPPGCGKTLTAEAVAELLHKPLYCVSMGELGTTPETLEDRLMEVLELCAGWGALALIDEADMLLEARTSSSDIVRNAMVCVMLRLLEYHQGILFLTTNRVNALDAAFQSRVSCALRYDALDEPSRHAIWRDLLSRARDNVGPEVDPAMLATHKLNGRQIKNVLQLAEALSRHEGTTVQQRHLDATLEMTAAFVAEVAEGK